jgi:hypothetical protein
MIQIICNRFLKDHFNNLNHRNKVKYAKNSLIESTTNRSTDNSQCYARCCFRRLCNCYKIFSEAIKSGVLILTGINANKEIYVYQLICNLRSKMTGSHRGCKIFLLTFQIYI